jgi:hypothetical protein
MNSSDTEPWIIYQGKTCALGGNTAGFQRLRDSIDRLISGEGNPIEIQGEDIAIMEIRLAERPEEIPRPPFGPIRNLVLFIVLLTLFLILAAVGFITSVNCLTAI